MHMQVIFGSIIAFITILLLLLRTNSAVVFFSICAGSVLSLQLASEASLISSTVIKNGDVNLAVVSIGLLILPALLSMFILRGSISAGKLAFNLLPSLATGGLLILLVVPLLPSSVSGQILASSAWDKLLQFQPIILVVGVITSIMLLFFTQNHKKNSKKFKKSQKAFKE